MTKKTSVYLFVTQQLRNFWEEPIQLIHRRDIYTSAKSFKLIELSVLVLL